MFNQAKHREVLFNILRKIYSSPVGKYLGFKGGTMLYFFYNLDRFSIDLDFDLLDLDKGDLVQREIKKILSELGNVKDEADKRNTIFFLLDYGQNQANVKIEISKIGFSVDGYEIKNFYGIDVKTQKIEHSFANKLVASLDRKKTANRDFYDIEFMFRNGFSFNKAIIKQRTQKNARNFLNDLLVFLEKYNPSRGWVDGLGELVNEEKKRWIKNNLKREVIGQIKFYLDEKAKNNNE